MGRSGSGRTWQNCEISYYKYYTDFADFFSISLVCNMFFTLMLVEVKLNGM